MDKSNIDPRLLTPEQLAGPHYREMLRTKEDTLKFLSHSDVKLRLAAILLCWSTWKCGLHPSLVDACRKIAESSLPDAVRSIAISALGEFLEASKNPEISRLLAAIIMDPSNSRNLQIEAYWSLRMIQYGLPDTCFDNFVRNTIYTAKDAMRLCPEKFSEEEVKSKLVPAESFPEGFWESAEEIDFDFVRQFIG